MCNLSIGLQDKHASAQEKGGRTNNWQTLFGVLARKSHGNGFQRASCHIIQHPKVMESIPINAICGAPVGHGDVTHQRLYHGGTAVQVHTCE
jgi:hypothetical protein